MRRLGKAYAHPLVVLIHLENETEDIRVGVAAGKNIGKAVTRNRAKRLLRAAIAPFLSQIKPGQDILLLARGPILEVKSTQLKQILANLLKKAKILNECQP